MNPAPLSFVFLLFASMSMIIQEKSRKVNIIFGDRLSVEERAELCTLIYYPEERLEIVHETIKDLESWYKITLNQLIEICKLVASNILVRK